MIDYSGELNRMRNDMHRKLRITFRKNALPNEIEQHIIIIGNFGLSFMEIAYNKKDLTHLQISPDQLYQILCSYNKFFLYDTLYRIEDYNEYASHNMPEDNKYVYSYRDVVIIKAKKNLARIHILNEYIDKIYLLTGNNLDGDTIYNGKEIFFYDFDIESDFGNIPDDYYDIYEDSESKILRFIGNTIKDFNKIQDENVKFEVLSKKLFNIVSAFCNLANVPGGNMAEIKEVCERVKQRGPMNVLSVVRDTDFEIIQKDGQTTIRSNKAIVLKEHNVEKPSTKVQPSKRMKYENFKDKLDKLTKKFTSYRKGERLNLKSFSDLNADISLTLDKLLKKFVRRHKIPDKANRKIIECARNNLKLNPNQKMSLNLLFNKSQVDKDTAADRICGIFENKKGDKSLIEGIDTSERLMVEESSALGPPKSDLHQMGEESKEDEDEYVIKERSESETYNKFIDQYKKCLINAKNKNKSGYKSVILYGQGTSYFDELFQLLEEYILSPSHKVKNISSIVKKINADEIIPMKSIESEAKTIATFGKIIKNDYYFLSLIVFINDQALALSSALSKNFKASQLTIKNSLAFISNKLKDVLKKNKCIYELANLLVDMDWASDSKNILSIPCFLRKLSEGFKFSSEFLSVFDFKYFSFDLNEIYKTLNYIFYSFTFVVPDKIERCLNISINIYTLLSRITEKTSDVIMMDPIIFGCLIDGDDCLYEIINKQFISTDDIGTTNLAIYCKNCKGSMLSDNAKSVFKNKDELKQIFDNAVSNTIIDFTKIGNILMSNSGNNIKNYISDNLTYFYDQKFKNQMIVKFGYVGNNDDINNYFQNDQNFQKLSQEIFRLYKSPLYFRTQIFFYVKTNVLGIKETFDLFNTKNKNDNDMKRLLETQLKLITYDKINATAVTVGDGFFLTYGQMKKDDNTTIKTIAGFGAHIFFTYKYILVDGNMYTQYITFDENYIVKTINETYLNFNEMKINTDVPPTYIMLKNMLSVYEADENNFKSYLGRIGGDYDINNVSTFGVKDNITFSFEYAMSVRKIPKSCGDFNDENYTSLQLLFTNHYFNERQYEYDRVNNVFFTYIENYKIGGKCFFNALLQGFLSLSHFRNALFNKNTAYYLSQVKNNSVKVIDHMGVLLHLKYKDNALLLTDDEYMANIFPGYRHGKHPENTYKDSLMEVVAIRRNDLLYRGIFQDASEIYSIITEMMHGEVEPDKFRDLFAQKYFDENFIDANDRIKTKLIQNHYNALVANINKNFIKQLFEIVTLEVIKCCKCNKSKTHVSHNSMLILKYFEITKNEAKDAKISEELGNKISFVSLVNNIACENCGRPSCFSKYFEYIYLPNILVVNISYNNDVGQEGGEFLGTLQKEVEPDPKITVTLINGDKYAYKRRGIVYTMPHHYIFYSDNDKIYYDDSVPKLNYDKKIYPYLIFYECESKTDAKHNLDGAQEKLKQISAESKPDDFLTPDLYAMP